MAFESLKLLPTQKRAAPDAHTKRRTRLVDQIDKQIAFASGHQPGKTRRGRWFWMHSDGTFMLSIKYGRRELELTKGKTVINCATTEKLIEALQECRKVAVAGDFDSQLEKISGELRAAFRK